MNLPSTALPLPTAYYDRTNGGFWYQDAKETWLRFQQSDFVRFLRKFGYSSNVPDGQVQSGLDQVLMDIQMSQNVDYAGPLAGYRQGLVDMEGKSVLVTESPRIILPEPGEYAVLHAMLVNMFGEQQLPYFQAWCKLAHESISSGRLRPGQALVLAGARNSGKSLLQQIVTKLLGGRAAHPYLHMTGGTSFNSELFGAEHLVIDDQCGNSDFKSRQRLSAQFKMITAAGSQQCHPKGKPALTLCPFWRLTVSVNDDPESLLVLPLIREDLADKIMLFKIEQHAMPMPTRTNQERNAFWNQLLAELPRWLNYLQQWEIPEEMVGDRYGVTQYHHPQIMEAIESLAPYMKLLNLLEAEFNGYGHDTSWTGTAAQLEALLTAENSGSRYEARKLFYFSTACGGYLADLAHRHPEKVKRAGRKENQYFWTITITPEAHKPQRTRVPTPTAGLAS